MANPKAAVAGVVLLIVVAVGAFLAIYYGTKDDDDNKSQPDKRVTPTECLAKDGILSGDYCFNVDSSLLDWKDAEARCVKTHLGHLAAIENEAVSAEVAALLSAAFTWIGLNDRKTEGTFEYVNGDAVNFTNWVVGQPTSQSDSEAGANKDCVALVQDPVGQWQDIDCDSLPDPPSAPRSVVAEAGRRKAKVTWQEPESDGGSPVLNYTVTGQPGNHEVSIDADEDLEVEVTGLTGGTSYTFTVVATNDVGSSSPSAASTAVTVQAVAPSAPSDVHAEAGRDSVSIFYEPPADDGDAAIVGYRIERFNGSVIEIVADRTAADSVPFATAASNTVSFVYRVRARNSVGFGPGANTSSISGSAALPTPVLNVTAVAGPDHNEATVSFDEPADEGASAITTYTVYSTPASTPVQGDSSPITLTGLTVGVSYTFVVTATNGAGSSAASSPSAAVVPFAVVPDTMGAPTATPGPRSANVSFAPPDDDGGAAITNFTIKVEETGAEFHVTADANSIVIPDLSPRDTFSFRVAASNSIGRGIFSAASTPLAPLVTVPDPAVNVSAVKGPRRASVHFDVADDGGSNITSVIVYAQPGNLSTEGTDSPVLVEDLTAFQNYTFTVVLFNAEGSSNESLPSAAVTIDADLPTAPVGVDAEAGRRNVTVSYDLPSDNGGAPVLDFEVRLVSAVTDLTVAVQNSSQTQFTFTDITAGEAVIAVVRARNVVGYGPSSSSPGSVTPEPSVPGPPRNVVAEAGDARVKISYAAPITDGDSAILRYTIISSDGDVEQVDDDLSSPAIIVNLTNGVPYSFRVFATNAVGDGEVSELSNEVRPKPPGENSESSSSSTAAVAGGIIGALLLVILIFAIYAWRKSIACFARKSTADGAFAETGSKQKLASGESQLESAVALDVTSHDSSDTLPTTASAASITGEAADATAGGSTKTLEH